MAKRKFKIRLPKIRVKSFYLAYYLVSFALVLVVVAIILIFSYPQISKTSRHFISENIKNQITSEVNTIQVNINDASSLIKNLNVSFSKYQRIPEENRRNYYTQLLEDIIRSHDELLGVFTLWKPYGIDKLDDKLKEQNPNRTGQFGLWYQREGEVINSIELGPQQFSLIHEYSELFKKITRSIFYIMVPMKEYSLVFNDTIYYARFLSPIRDSNGVIQGFVGIDVPIDFFVSNVPVEQLKNLYILNQDLQFIFTPDRSDIGYKLTTLYPQLINDKLVYYLYRYIPFVGKGNYFNKKLYIFTYPIIITEYNKWNIIKTYPPSIFSQVLRRFTFLLIFITTLFIILITFLFIGLRAIMKRQIQIYYSLIESIYLGNPQVRIHSRLFKYEEFRGLENIIHKTIDKLRKQIEFTENLVNENYDIEPLPLASDKDYLNQTLNRLADKLREGKKAQEILQREQELESWKNTGLAKFNELLRKYINDLEQLAYETISELTEYIGGVVGAFFILVEESPEEKYLELIGYYGYTRKIYEKKRFELGEGLAGTIALEKKPIITKVPDEYVELATGLGKAKPNYIAVYPLITTDILFGVIEIAKIEPFEKHHIEFLDEISSVIASTLASAKVTAETRRLLEQSRKATEQMHIKEKQLQETIKKIEKLRQESEQQRVKLESIVNALNEIVYYAEFSPTQKVLTINRLLINLLNTSYAEATSKNYFDLFQIPIHQIEEHKKFWEKLKLGHRIVTEMELLLEQKVWIKAVLVPVIRDMQLDRVLFIGIDMTELKQKEQEIEKSIIELHEKQEQITVQEEQLQITLKELEEAYHKIEEKDKTIKQLKDRIAQLELMYNTLTKEFEKRVKRARKIQAAMREKIDFLEQELEQCRKQLEQLQNKNN